MTEEVPAIPEKALSLASEARAATADPLLESFEATSTGQEVEAAWSQEIKRRLEDIDSGRVQLIPGEEVRRRLITRLSDAGK